MGLLASLTASSQAILADVPTAWLVAIAAVFSLFVWRLWRFTISPLLHPDDPKELPYWIPSKSIQILQVYQPLTDFVTQL